MMAEVTFRGETLYGVVKFLGNVYVKDRLTYIAGLELVCSIVILIFSTYTSFLYKKFVYLSNNAGFQNCYEASIT